MGEASWVSCYGKVTLKWMYSCLYLQIIFSYTNGSHAFYAVLVLNKMNWGVDYFWRLGRVKIVTGGSNNYWGGQVIVKDLGG